MEFRPRLYTFSTSLAWTEGKNGRLSSTGKHPVDIACPPEFGGPGGFWSPEDLLVASVEVCVMTTFLHLLGRRKIELGSYTSQTDGVAGLEQGEFRFVRINLGVEIEIHREVDRKKTMACIEAAGEQCMVSRSLRCPVHVEYTVSVAGAAGRSAG